MTGNYIAPARPRLPDEAAVDFADPVAVKAYMRSLNAAIVQHLSQRQVTGSTVAARLYVSPNGAAWQVSISDAGAWVIESKAGPKP